MQISCTDIELLFDTEQHSAAAYQLHIMHNQSGYKQSSATVCLI